MLFNSLFHLYELWNIKHSLCRLRKQLAYHTVPVSCIVGAGPGRAELQARPRLHEMCMLLR